MNKDHLLLLLCLIIAGCCENERHDGCHLDKLNLQGNIVKVETIVQSTMPLTEMFYDVFGTNAICISGGNTMVKFDRHGFIQKYEGYGLDGELLFSEKNISIDPATCIGPTVLGANLDERIGHIDITGKEEDRVTEVKYYSYGGELLWGQKADYDNNGDICRITKKYASLSYHSDLFNIEYNDTTYYRYLNYDEHGNWTEVEVAYHGILPKQNSIYKVKRQITYKGESEKAPLLEQLGKYNDGVLIYTDDSTEWQTVQLGTYGQITLPTYMRPVSNYQEAPSAFRTINLCTYEYGERDAYASYSVSMIPGFYPFEDMPASDFAYFKEVDEQYKEQMEQSLSEGGIYMFKWLPYEYTKICGYWALRLRYYRYGKGYPIPVYVEIYSISAPYGEVNVTFSYQSNHTNRFSKPFKESLESMILE